jgi:hypothetical protein
MLANTARPSSVASAAAEAVAAGAVRLAGVSETPAPSPIRPDRAGQLHRWSVSTLTGFALGARSQSLASAIRAAIDAMNESHRLLMVHSKAASTEKELRERGASEAEQDAAGRAEEETDEAWTRHRRDVLQPSADRVAAAPVTDIEDALMRAEAVGHIAGTLDPEAKDGIPDCEEDLRQMYTTLREGIHEIAARRIENEEGPDVCHKSHYDRVNDDLNRACAEEDDHNSGRIVLDPAAREELEERLKRGYTEKDRLANLVLARKPSDLTELLLLLEVMADYGSGRDLGTYACRDRGATANGECAEPLTVEILRNAGPGEDRALAILGKAIARLRDLHMPSDWRDLWVSLKRMHPNARDAAWRAYDLEMDARAFRGVQLHGRPDEHLPILTFEKGPERFVTIGPIEGFDWRPVK